MKYSSDSSKPAILLINPQPGIETQALFMLGLPFDTPHTMQETINLAKGPYFKLCSFFVTTLFLGVNLYEEIAQKGSLLFDLSITSTVYTSGSATYEMDRLKAKDVEIMFRKADRQFYWRPIQLLRYISSRINFRDLSRLAKGIHRLFLEEEKIKVIY